jgi:hypothetical protein
LGIESGKQENGMEWLERRLGVVKVWITKSISHFLFSSFPDRKNTLDPTPLGCRDGNAVLDTRVSRTKG